MLLLAALFLLLPFRIKARHISINNSLLPVECSSLFFFHTKLILASVSVVLCGSWICLPNGPPYDGHHAWRCWRRRRGTRKAGWEEVEETMGAKSSFPADFNLSVGWARHSGLTAAVSQDEWRPAGGGGGGASHTRARMWIGCMLERTWASDRRMDWRMQLEMESSLSVWN